MPKTLTFRRELIDDHADLVEHGGIAMVVPLTFEEAAKTGIAVKTALECLARNLVSFDHLRSGFVDSMPAPSASADLYVKALDSVIGLNAANMNSLEAAMLVLDRAAFVHCVADDQPKGIVQ